MRSVVVSVLVCVLLAAPSARTQQPEVLLRATRIIANVVGSSRLSSRACFAIYQNGSFFVEHQDEAFEPATKIGKVIEGKLSDSDLQQLRSLTAFVKTEKRLHLETGQVHRHLEMLMVEVERDTGTDGAHFIDYDGKNSFTPEASALNDWLKSLEKIKGRRVKDASHTLCF